MHTFQPDRPKIGTWKSNEVNNAGKVVRFQSTVDKLMSKYKKEKADPMNEPLKKGNVHLQSKRVVKANCVITNFGS